MSCAFCGTVVEAFTENDQLQEQVPEPSTLQVQQQPSEYVSNTDTETNGYECQTLPVQHCLYTAQGEIQCSP